MELQCFDMEDVSIVMDCLHKTDPSPEYVTVELAPELRRSISAKQTPLPLRNVDIQRIAEFVDHPRAQSSDAVHRVDELSPELTEQSVSEVLYNSSLSADFIHKLETIGMTDEERNLTAFTRPRLMKLKNWKDWDASLLHQRQSSCCPVAS